MGFSSKHLTVCSPETVNIEKLANLTANTKNYRQITLNTKPHSDPLQWVTHSRLLGVTIDDRLNWSKHINQIMVKKGFVNKLNLLKRSRFLPKKHVRFIF